MSINEVIPFFAVRDMRASIAFYVDGLGFSIEDKWVDEGLLRWCRLQIGGARLMLQQYRTEGHDSRQFRDNRGEGVSLSFECDDAVALYREWRGNGLSPSEPQVGNGMWVTHLVDPDGYHLSFQSRTDTPEDRKLSEFD